MLEGETRSWAGESDGLVGRDASLAALRDVLVDGGRAAIVTGPAGAGKTSLLAAAARGAAAEGVRVLGHACHASDQALGFGALVDLLSDVPEATPMLDLLLPRAEGSPAIDPLRLRLELLEWLAGLGAEQPVLVVVDDVHWCDASSLSVLGFLARRLPQSRASLLVGSRGAPPAPLERLHRVELVPLDERDSRTVLRRAGLLMDMAARDSVIEHAEGIPLALLEFGRAAVAGASPGTIPPTVETAFTHQLASLPEPTRQVLLLASACGGALTVLSRVRDTRHLVEDLAPAEGAGLVTVTDRVVRFRHPLARAAAYASATAADRMAAHAVLATAYADDPARRIWHRAEATVTPDENVAIGLAEAAERAQSQGASAEAARLMSRAAELTEQRELREQREFAAVEQHIGAGNFDLAVELAQPLRTMCEDPAIRARAGHAVAYALTQIGRHEEARTAVLDALEPTMRADTAMAWALLTTLAVLDYRANEPAGEVARWLDRFDRELGDTPVPEITAAARAWIRVQTDPLEVPESIVTQVLQAPVPDHYPLPLAASHEMLLGATAWLLGETRVASTRLSRSVDMMQRAQAPGQMSQTLASLALVQIEAGDYAAADSTVRLLSDVSEARGLHNAALAGLDLQARLAALRGDLDRARELCDRALLDLHVREHFSFEASVRTAMCWVRSAEGDAQGAWDEVRWLFGDDGEPRHPHVCYKDLCHFVAAAMRAGATDQATRIVEVAEQRLAKAGTPYQLQLARARSLVSAEDAEPYFRQAITDPVAIQRPFEMARAQLEYGAWLRRRYRQTEGRHQLQSALATFDRLGTRAWSELATAELRAAGVATVAPDGSDHSALAALTAQEREVVRHAARGLTNREIAATLQLSPKTVSTHLYNAFPKLGVSARSQLRDVVGTQTAG